MTFKQILLFAGREPAWEMEYHKVLILSLLRKTQQRDTMAPTKLCIVTHTFLPHIGGIERVVYEQSKRLMKKNFDLKVVTHKNYTPNQYSYNEIKVQ